jgi:hypothetical protein
MRSSTLAPGPVADAERRLRELRAARDAVTTNLLDLEADGSYALLKAGNGLSGTTAERARPALARVEELWRGLQLLDDLIDRVDAFRGTGRLDDRKARELLALLDGPSITLPPESVPLSERSLTGASSVGRATTAQALLTGMEEAFTELRDVVAAVDQAWRDLLPRVDRATAEAERLAAELPGHRGVAAVRSTLTTVAAELSDDPLGVAGQVEVAEASLAAIEQAAREVRQRREQLAADLAVARRDLDTLVATIDAGRTAFDESRHAVADPTGLYDPLDPTVLVGERGLDPWLTRLDALHREGQVDKALRGLTRWRAVADDTAATARQVAEANARPARRRRELRGLLRAAQAKAGAEGRAEDPGLAEVGRRAHAAIDVPCRLADAEQLVRQYLAELRRVRGGSR